MKKKQTAALLCAAGMLLLSGCGEKECVHQFGSWEQTVAATCSAEGTERRNCSQCIEYEERSIPKIEHRMDGAETVLKAATCVAEGEKQVACSLCGFVVAEKIEKGDHAYGKDLKCTVCGLQGTLAEAMTEQEKTDGLNCQYKTQIAGYHDDQKGGYLLQWGYLAEDKTTYLKPAAEVGITIVNNAGETVYTHRFILRAADYKENVAEIWISDSDIRGGQTESGVVSIATTIPDRVSSGPVTAQIVKLPLAPLNITLPQLPLTVHEYDSKGNIEASVKLTGITYELYYQDSAKVNISGEKVYAAEGKENITIKAAWKLYDAEGVVIDNGTCYLSGLGTGDKFSKEISSWNKVRPGGTYRLEILSVE